MACLSDHLRSSYNWTPDRLQTETRVRAPSIQGNFCDTYRPPRVFGGEPARLPLPNPPSAPHHIQLGSANFLTRVLMDRTTVAASAACLLIALDAASGFVAAPAALSGGPLLPPPQSSQRRPCTCLIEHMLANRDEDDAGSHLLWSHLDSPPRKSSSSRPILNICVLGLLLFTLSLPDLRLLARRITRRT